MTAAAAIAISGDAAGAKGTGKAKGGKKKLILIAAPVLLIVILAGLWFSGILPSLLGMSHEPAKAETKADGKGDGKEAAATPHVPIFVELPDMVSNLNAPGRRPIFVKLKARIELAKPEDQAIFAAAQPRVIDLFQTYLREMRPEELRGSAGTYRLREELIARANIAVAPARVVDVLFTELLVQ
jgi:flagellar FliL protein